VLGEHTAARQARSLEGELDALLATRTGKDVTLQSNGIESPRSSVEHRINALAPWFHNLHLPSGHQTAPDHPLGDFPAFKWRELEPALPSDLTGWRALDIGCNAGAYTFELARRGAHVLGVDHDEHYLRQAQWARELYGLENRVRIARMDIYALARIPETFDLVFFLGLLYHLRHPLLGLDIAAAKTNRLLAVQSLSIHNMHVLDTPADLPFERRDALLEPGWPKLAFVEHRLANDATNWWVPDAGCLEAMVRSTGMEVVARPADETYVCRPAPGAADRVASVRAELRAATAAEL